MLTLSKRFLTSYIIIFTIILCSFSLFSCIDKDAPEESELQHQADSGEEQPQPHNPQQENWVNVADLSSQQDSVIDFTSDGRDMIYVEHQGDVLHVYLDDEYGNNVAYMVRQKNGDMTILYDINEDGNTDIQYSFSPSAQEETALIDSDFDGFPETKRKVFWDDSQNKYILVIYSFNGDEYVEQSREEVPDEIEALGRFSGVPEEKTTKQLKQGKRNASQDPLLLTNVCPEGTEKTFFGLPGIYICVGNTEGGCSEEETIQLKKTFRCMFDRYKTCIRETNKIYWYGFILFSSIGAWPGFIGVQCVSELKDENGNNGALANTTLGIPFHHSHMKFNRSRIESFSENDLCGLAIHEFIHAMGRATIDGSIKDRHDLGTDSIYSCGRYCGFCSQAATGTSWKFESNIIECYNCADSPERKLACGYKEERIDDCFENYSVCHAGLGVILDECEKCRSAAQKTCHQKEEDIRHLGSRSVGQWCCEKCPDTANRSNDMPCLEPMDALIDLCSTPPPFCKNLKTPD